jgi:preprotein translocase subunit SecA
MGLFNFSSWRRKLATCQTYVPRIEALAEDYHHLDDEGLRSKSAELRRRSAQGEADMSLLPEVFALVRETSQRVIGLRPFPVQLLGGIVLYNGNIAEMKTGEGKTLVATAPLFLNAVVGHRGHLVTVNDYLAKRDRVWMGPVYEFLGMSVGLLQNDSSPEQRRAAYGADITYGTNNEFGFDYLRDHMAIGPDAIVQKGQLDYAIVDEVDNIFIDEARTALIIAGPSEQGTTYYYEAARIAARLRGLPVAKPESTDPGEEPPADIDYTFEEKFKNVSLTEAGVRRVEKAFHVNNLAAPENLDYMRHINQALRAREFFHNDAEYIVKEGEVVIVDEFTGRLMYGRRYSDGLHQAIEAKEGLKVREENQTLASITIQNFFKMYRKLGGMTGTASTEADEFKEIYGLDVVEIPTNEPVVRRDYDDEVYRSERGKQQALLAEVKARNDKGQPVLVGTRSVEKSELLSRELKKLGVKHQVLNAKYHEREAEIIAQAGRKGSVTIATNMAGRGVDILLGGNPEALARVKLDLAKQPEEYERRLAEYRSTCANEHNEVVALGGLFILGTERHESRRIDNQLRGRSGRQGDPGESKFFLSAEDDILRIFGGDRIQRVFEMMRVDELTPVNHPLLSKTIEMSQKKVEAYNFDARKTLLDYDNVLNKQREVIYAERDKVLAGIPLVDEVHEFIKEGALSIAQQVAQVYAENSDGIGRVYNDLVLESFGRPIALTEAQLLALLETRDAVHVLAQEVGQRAEEAYEAKYRQYGENLMHQVEHLIFLRNIDFAWKGQLLQMETLKEGMSARAYGVGGGEKGLLILYVKEATDTFNELMDQIKRDITRTLFTFELQPAPSEKPHDRT